jgi:transcription-repair coupling factor (superfamily II helicase)
MLLQYAEDAKLYVPVDRLDLVQKFGVAEGGQRTLDKLGGPGWDRIKTRVKKAIRDMTKELLDLYAKRKAIPGRAFSPDTPWQREFEDAFPYALTPDQERAIADVKADMEAPRPMERLLCGDVGYGKTEVAMRAAFKAVQDGAQVAILAPTTVLAFQHGNTLRARFAAFPISIESISRFARRPRRAEVPARVAQEADIPIGTHRSCPRTSSSGPWAPDRGRGAALRRRPQGAAEADVGIDTRDERDADPAYAPDVPRRGARPLGHRNAADEPARHPDEPRSFNRGTSRRDPVQAPRGAGLLSTTATNPIHKIAAKVQEIVPEARIAVTHGRMERSRSRRRWCSSSAVPDILVSTTIIENGPDIPRVNTLA